MKRFRELSFEEKCDFMGERIGCSGKMVRGIYEAIYEAYNDFCKEMEKLGVIDDYFSDEDYFFEKIFHNLIDDDAYNNLDDYYLMCQKITKEEEKAIEKLIDTVDIVRLKKYLDSKYLL